MRRQVVAVLALSAAAGGFVVDGFGRVPTREPSSAGWAMTYLGILGHGYQTWSEAVDINEAGVILGKSYADVGGGAAASEGTGAFLWSNGRMVRLLPADRAFHPDALNNRGEVAGTGARHAVLLRAGKRIDLGSLGVSTTSWAAAINESGEVVGSIKTKSGHQHAFLWRDGRMIELPSPGGANRDSGATAINDAGQVVGSVEVSAHVRHAVLWKQGKMLDLGTLGPPSGGYTSAANAINNRGEIVGYSDTRRGQHAFLWKNGTMRDIGKLTPFSVATGVNDRGQVVGYTARPWQTPNGGQEEMPHAVVWQNGRASRLTPGESKYVASIPAAINNHGQIAGRTAAFNQWTHSRAVLWTPR